MTKLISTVLHVVRFYLRVSYLVQMVELVKTVDANALTITWEANVKLGSVGMKLSYVPALYLL